MGALQEHEEPRTDNEVHEKKEIAAFSAGFRAPSDSFTWRSDEACQDSRRL